MIYTKNGNILKVEIKNTMKKTIITTLICLFISPVLVSQNKEKLDEKNGFRDFKLGDTYSKWQSNLSYQESRDGVKRYFYTGNCCNTLYNYPVKRILLDFENNKLITISLLHETIPEDSSDTKIDPGKIYNKLIEDFGKFDTSDKTEGSGKIYLYWFGKKVDLLFVWTYLGLESSETFEIVLFDNKSYKNKNNDGF